MTVFANYSRYYNLLYRDKDYLGEAQFVHQLIQTYAPNTQSILDLGCGTGNHAFFLAQEGYRIHGVDRSAEMLQQANAHLAQLPPEIASRLSFSQGDIREIRLDRQFDAIVSLFHVMSYQTTNEDLQAALATVKAHLKSQGVFMFDCWYGPAVLSNRPTIRVKRLEDEQIQVTRIAEPLMYPNENIVDVNYQVFIEEKNNGKIEQLQETHKMRYLFKSEIELILRDFDLKVIDSGEWMTQKTLEFYTWSAYFVVK